MDLTTILAKYGLDASELAVLAALVTFTIALVKKHLHTKGNWNFVAAIVATGVWTVIFYLPIPKEIVAGVVVLVMSTGGWQTVKDLVGKVGEDQFTPLSKPSRNPG